MTDNPQPPAPPGNKHKQAIAQLAEEVLDEQCILFLGNDLPLGFPQTAPPCRKELAGVLASDLDIPPGEEGRLPTVAQAYEDTFSRYRLQQKLIDSTDKPEYQPAWLHRLAAALPVKGYVTTAYDPWLERALRERGRTTINIVDDPDTPFEGQAEASIVKLHGEASRPDSLVLTDTDYWELPGQVELKLQNVQHYFNTKTILIVGYDLSDQSFKQLYFAVKNRIGKFGRQLYAVYPNCPGDTQSFWAKQNIKILDTDPQTFLTNLLAAVEAIEHELAVPEEFQLLDKPPYKYLDAYTEQDQDIFCGRDTDALLVWGKILSFRTTMLFGASGTGKTSLLQAGVAPRLARTGYRTAVVRLLGDPVEEVMRTVQQARGGEATALPVDLLDLFRGLPETERWVVCLDQFEEFFVRQPPAERARFRDQVAACTRDGERDVRFVFALREDFVGQMQELRAVMPDLWLNSHRLMPLSRGEAVLAVVRPAARAGLHYEPGLVETLLDDLSEHDSVAPPNLQIVCEHLYKQVAGQEAEEAQSRVAEWQTAHPDFDPGYPVCHAVTVGHYRESGGAHAILRGHLDQALARLAPDESSPARERLQDVLRALLERGETTTTKAVLTAARIAERADVPLLDTEAILRKLSSPDYRLVRSMHEGREHELAHECLIAAIEAWPESVQRTRARDIKNMLREHLKMSELLSQKLLERVWEERENPRLNLGSDELELLLRSALAVGYAVAYWFERAWEGGVAVSGILREGLSSPQPNIRADTAAILGVPRLAEAVSWLADALDDDYPHVRAQARAALQKIATKQARQVLRDHPPQDMIYIPAGEFIMGSDQAHDDQKPVHNVYLDAFYIGKYPVTNAEYARFVECTNRRPPGHWPQGQIPQDKEDHPVANLTWYQARDYAEWAGMRLPTEAEWEKAARGGLQIPNFKSSIPNTIMDNPQPDREYPWGDEFDPTRCNTMPSGISGTTPVGKYSPHGDSPYGCADMAGNVWEWVADWYGKDYYSNSPKRNPQGPDLGVNRTIRGGSWKAPKMGARIAYRSYPGPSTTDDYGGFRCACSVSGSTEVQREDKAT